MLVLGEVRTCLLQNSSAATRTDVAELLRLSPGERVRSSERPLSHAVSPELLSGVDCQVPAASGARLRGIGTVTSRGVVVGGRILQGSVHTLVVRGGLDRRLPWSHYLGRPGVIETIGRFDRHDVTSGFLAEPRAPAVLDLGALGDLVIGRVQMNPRLDHAPPFKSRRTWLRWVLRTDELSASAAGGEFTVVDDTLRTLHMSVDGAALPSVVEFCEDLALHDWVLTTLLQLVERSKIGSVDGPEPLTRLRPAIDHLLHLWMPGARVAQSLLPMWDSLERRPGFTRQWQATVTRIRDQIAVHTLGMLGRLLSSAPERIENGGDLVARQR